MVELSFASYQALTDERTAGVKGTVAAPTKEM
jgi:hypothetical protein